MSRVYWFCSIMVWILSITACSPTAASVETATLAPPSDTPEPTAALAMTDAPTLTSTVTPTETPPATETPAPLTATFNAFIAAQTQMVGTAFAQFGPMAHLSGFSMFYANPVGTPLQSWHDVPIMPEATAGQEFQSDIYSYKAGVTLQKATSYYSGQANVLGWSCIQSTGTGGTGDMAMHDAEFVCGPQTIVIAAFDNDASQVLVVINKSP